MGYLFPSSCGREYSSMDNNNNCQHLHYFYCFRQHPILMLHTHITTAPTNRTMRSHGFFISIFNLSLLNFHLAPSQKLNRFSAFRYRIRGSLGGHAPQPHSDIFLLSCGMQWQLKGLMKCEEVGQINLTPCLVVGLHCY